MDKLVRFKCKDCGHEYTIEEEGGTEDYCYYCQDENVLKQRSLINIDLINPAILKRIILALNKLDDGEFIDVLKGQRGDLSDLRRQNGSFKIYEETCQCGNTENIPCQWLKENDGICGGNHCPNYLKEG